MKGLSGIAIKSLARACVTILLVTGATHIGSASADSEAIVHTVAGLTYVSGGVGSESIDRLNALAGDFNLKMVFAATSGAYLSDVRVTIANASGTPLLETVSEGPWLLAQLPRGEYRIVANFAGHALQRQISVGAAKLMTVDFRWAAD